MFRLRLSHFMTTPAVESAPLARLRMPLVHLPLQFPLKHTVTSHTRCISAPLSSVFFVINHEDEFLT